MNILTINAGSSSVKYALFDMKKGKKLGTCLLKGLFEEIDHNKKNAYLLVFKKILYKLREKQLHVDAVAHRVVHGLDITRSVKIDKGVVNTIRKACHVAPLHNPHNLEGITVCQKLFKVPHVAVFDTSFHATLPAKAYTYALPAWLTKKYGWRRYGFHGTSHSYVANEAAKMLKKPLTKLNMVTCHLGNGASLCAIQKGKSIDTSMGFTPLEGLVMGTRCGDIDPALVCLLQEKGFSEKDAYELLNDKSGLFGLTGTNDVRKLLAKKGKDPAKLALAVYTYRVAKYLGAYVAAMNGVDVIVFTAGAGEGSWFVRESVLNYFTYLGVKVDKAKNKKITNGSPACAISKGGSKVKVLVVPTNESLMMAKETMKVLKK